MSEFEAEYHDIVTTLLPGCSVRFDPDGTALVELTLRVRQECSGVYKEVDFQSKPKAGTAAAMASAIGMLEGMDHMANWAAGKMELVAAGLAGGGSPCT